MLQSLKGAGGLSRKLLTILVLAAMPMLGYTADNSIYIDQTGTGATINITQDGAGNTVQGISNSGTAGIRTDAATLNGDGAQINITQVGSGNTLSLSSQGGKAVGSSQETSITSTTTAENTNTLIKNVGDSNVIAITQTGNQSNVDARVTGNSNGISITSAGQGDVVQASITGGNSNINIGLFDTGGSNTVNANTQGGSIGIKIDGTGNYVDAASTGVGNDIKIGGYAGGGSSLVGIDNTLQIAQNGNGNSANIALTGSTNFVGINQANTGLGGQSATVKISGDSNTVNISQGISTGGVGFTAGSNFLTPVR
jgi:hypothetical protein